MRDVSFTRLLNMTTSFLLSHLFFILILSFFLKKTTQYISKKEKNQQRMMKKMVEWDPILAISRWFGRLRPLAPQFLCSLQEPQEKAVGFFSLQ